MKYILNLNGEPKLEKLEEHAEIHPSNLLSGVVTALMELTDISWSYTLRLEFSRRSMGGAYITLVVDGGKNHVNMKIYDKLLSYPFIDTVAIKIKNGKAGYHASVNRDWYQSSNKGEN